MRSEDAAALAIDALAHIAADEDLAAALLAQSGLTPDDLRARAAEPELLGFVIEFLAQNEAALVAFAADRRMKPETVLRARRALPGGAHDDWG